jgi:hypothetical protein
MPSLGLGLSLGSSNPFKGFDGDVSVFINQHGIAQSATIPMYGINLLPSSNNFMDTASIWSHSLCSVTPNALSNPFGTATDAFLLSNINASFGNLLRMQNFIVGQYFYTNTRYLWSTYAKANASNFIGFRLGDIAANAGNNYSNVNLSNGAVNLLTPTNGTNHSLTATAVGNGWYRIAYSFTNNTSTTNVLDIAVCQSDGQVGTISPAGTRSVYIWGTQIEITSNTTPSPYAETGSNLTAIAQLRPSGTLLTETINPRKQLNDFVVGVKGLGLWSNIIFWPMRSHQNRGTGALLYSMGGYGNFTGSFSSSGPVWGNSGILFNGTNSQIVLSNSIISSNTGSLFYCGMHSATKPSISQKAINFGNIEIGKAENAQGLEATNLKSPFPTVGRTSIITGYAPGVFYTGTGVYTPASTLMSRFYNAGQKESNTTATYGTFVNEDTAVIGGRTSATNSPFYGPIAIAAYFNTPLSDASVASFNSLYKTTLGSGLGLP